jgi:hypothetical protein
MITERFEIPSRLKATGTILSLIGVLTLIIGFISLLGGDTHDQTRFWIVLLLDSIYFLFLAVISVFIMAAAGLAQGGWIAAYRRIPESIGANVWIFGLIALVVMFCCAFVAKTPIYEWVNHHEGFTTTKSFLLNPTSFVIFSIIFIGLWSWFGRKYRSMSLQEDKAPRNSTKIYWKMVALSGGFMVVFGLSMMSIGPWLWIMSLQPHWFSTLFSWYVFASAFVSGMALILLFVVYVKNAGYLSLVNKEHMHDLGKFMFAFSIFWTYLWFAQYLLIWYGNIPQETTYFKIRQQGPYSFFFYSSIILNFVLPILVLMTRPSKRNYFTIVFMAVLILFGHWVDFYIMIMPNVMKADWHLSWYEIGITLGFVGLMITVVSRTLAKANLITANNTFLKESIVHIS